jgi:hypothetical protein
MLKFFLLTDIQPNMLEASIQKLQFIRLELDRLILTSTPHGPLRFKNSPLAFGPFQQTIESASVNNQGLHSLVICTENRTFLDYQVALDQLLLDTGDVQSYNSANIQASRKELVLRIQEELSKLEQFKEVEWEAQRTGIVPDPFSQVPNTSTTQIVDTSTSICIILKIFIYL